MTTNTDNNYTMTVIDKRPDRQHIVGGDSIEILLRAAITEGHDDIKIENKTGQVVFIPKDF